MLNAKFGRELLTVKMKSEELYVIGNGSAHIDPVLNPPSKRVSVFLSDRYATPSVTKMVIKNPHNLLNSKETRRLMVDFCGLPCSGL